MNEIKPYVELTAITIGDSVVYTEKSVEKIAEYLEKNHFIVIDGVGYNRFEIKKFQRTQVNDLQAYIYGQPDFEKSKLLSKQRRLRDELNKEMTLEYAINYVNNMNKEKV